MDIIISANENILNMTRDKKKVVNEDMTEQEFFLWTNGIVKDIDKNELQEISV